MREANPSSLLVPLSRKSRAIPVLPLWTVRPVQSQCQYKRALFINFYIVVMWSINIYVYEQPRGLVVKVSDY